MAPPALRALRGPDGQSLAPPEESAATARERPLGERVALLCGGPSLRESWTGERAGDFDSIVAVNTAGWVVPAYDWMVASDRPLIEAVLKGDKPRPRVGLVCYRAYFLAVRRAGLWWKEIPRLAGVKSYTMPRAVRWCCFNGGTVEIFGCDWSGGPCDVAGVKGDHGALRWQNEALALKAAWSPSVVAVHGRLHPDRLAFIKGERSHWPG